MEDAWPTPLLLLAIFLKENNFPGLSWRFHPSHDILAKCRHDNISQQSGGVGMARGNGGCAWCVLEMEGLWFHKI